MLYISDKFQGVWMTNIFRMSVFYRALIVFLIYRDISKLTNCILLVFERHKA